MIYEFDSEIRVLEGKIKWNVFYFPYSAVDEFGAAGNIQVDITVDGQSFEHTLLPSKNGHYLVYNEFIRRAAGKKVGDILHVTLEKSNKKREFKLEDEYRELLLQAGILEVFLKQPDYIKREQINKIALAKKEETRQNRINALIAELKSK